MENNTSNVVDPITAKFDDNAAMQKLIRQATREAVEKARQLGLIPPDTTEVKSKN